MSLFNAFSLPVFLASLAVASAGQPTADEHSSVAQAFLQHAGSQPGGLTGILDQFRQKWHGRARQQLDEHGTRYAADPARAASAGRARSRHRRHPIHCPASRHLPGNNQARTGCGAADVDVPSLSGFRAALPAGQLRLGTRWPCRKPVLASSLILLETLPEVFIEYCREPSGRGAESILRDRPAGVPSRSRAR